MAAVKVKCPYYGSEEVVLYGKAGQGNSVCCTGTRRAATKCFSCRPVLFPGQAGKYANNACEPGTKEKIVEMAMNGAGVRDTGRVLDISPNTVTAVLKNGKIRKASQR